MLPAPTHPAPETTPASPRKIVQGAALSLLGFSLLTTVVLAAWFRREPDPWSWKAMLTIVSVVLGLTTSVLVWRAPSRTHATAGIAVLGFSLLRLGAPSDWGWQGLVLLVVTSVLAIPVVRAALVLRG